MTSSDSGRKILNRISFGSGLNSSEQLLKSLGDQSFLRFWSHANTYAKKGKELCDLLVICGDSVIVFSDKTAEFDKNKTPDLAWTRWYRRAIEDSSRQLLAAHRKIQRPGSTIFKDVLCQVNLGIPIPAPTSIKFYMVAVASFPKDAKNKDNFDPILSFDSGLKGANHVAPNAKPFVIGDINPGGPFFHVMDDAGLRAALTTLDTITDFTRYLDARENFLRGGASNTSESELGLLARYLMSFDDDGVPRDIDHLSPGTTSLTNTEWNSKEFQDALAAREHANQESYVWDTLIENHASLFETGGFEFASYTGIEKTERAVRQMALETRLNRRLLSRAWIEVCLRDNPAYGATLRTVPHSDQDTTTYVFLNLQHPEGIGMDEYKSKRRELLQSFMLASLIDFPDSKVIIGLAAGLGELPDAYDLAHFNVDEDADLTTIQKDAREAWNEKKKYFENLGTFKLDERDIPAF